MHRPAITLKDFYQAELAALRDEALEFAGKHPGPARALGLNRHQATDPHAELLIQSFAYLAGRLQYQRELDQALLPNALLGFLYPHLEAPVPSMLVAQVQVKPDGANFTNEQLLKRHSTISAAVRNELGQKTECRFRTAYDTPLVPLTVTRLELLPVAGFALPQTCAQARSVLRVRIETQGVTLQASGRQRLRFYIDSAEPNDATAYQLYETLSCQLLGVQLVPEAAAEASGTAIDADKLRWLGFADDEAMLEANPLTHPGFRLLQEYFAFRQKFMFFEVSDLPIPATGTHFDLLFYLDAPVYDPPALPAQALRLNCVPLVNLFPHRIEPLVLDHLHYEYRLQADLQNHRHYEIYALRRLESTRPNGEPRQIAPYFALGAAEKLATQDYFYVTRRECSRAADVAGTETYVSFLDLQFDLAGEVDEAIGGQALCTNRRLPEQMLAGQSLQLEGPGPVLGITALVKPTAHQTPEMIGSRPWALVSQLALNHLSLADGPKALAALKEVLCLHARGNRIVALREIDSLGELHCRAVFRPASQQGWRGFVRGTHVRLVMDRSKFDEGSPVLFCEVLRRFLALYATVNNVVEVSLETQDLIGNIKQWQAMAGAKTVL